MGSAFNRAAAILAFGALAAPAQAAAAPGDGSQRERARGGQELRHEERGIRTGSRVRGGEDRVSARKRPGASARGGKGRRVVNYVLRGTYVQDGTALSVTSGNRAARRAGLVGRTVALDLSQARIRVADLDGDGHMTVADVADRDRVVVQLKLSPSVLDASDGLRARRLVDLTHPEEDDAEEASDSEQAPLPAGDAPGDASSDGAV